METYGGGGIIPSFWSSAPDMNGLLNARPFYSRIKGSQLPNTIGGLMGSGVSMDGV
jgi:hypothetical protein